GDLDPFLADQLGTGGLAYLRCLYTGRPDHGPGRDLLPPRELDAVLGDRIDLGLQDHLDALALQRTKGRPAEGRHKLNQHMWRRLYKHHTDLVCVEVAV